MYRRTSDFVLLFVCVAFLLGCADSEAGGQVAQSAAPDPAPDPAPEAENTAPRSADNEVQVSPLNLAITFPTKPLRKTNQHNGKSYYACETDEAVYTLVWDRNELRPDVSEAAKKRVLVATAQGGNAALGGRMIRHKWTTVSGTPVYETVVVADVQGQLRYLAAQHFLYNGFLVIASVNTQHQDRLLKLSKPFFASMKLSADQSDGSLFQSTDPDFSLRFPGRPTKKPLDGVEGELHFYQARKFAPVYIMSVERLPNPPRTHADMKKLIDLAIESERLDRGAVRLETREIKYAGYPGYESFSQVQNSDGLYYTFGRTVFYGDHMVTMNLTNQERSSTKQIATPFFDTLRFGSGQR